MKIYSIIKEADNETMGLDHQSFWDSIGDENAWRNIIYYYLENDPSVSGNLTSRSRAIQAQANQAIRDLGPRVDTSFFQNVGRWINIANRYSFNLQSNDTWATIKQKIEPHKNYESQLPPPGPDSSGSQESASPYTDMTRNEFIQQTQSLDLRDNYSIIDFGDPLETSTQEALMVAVAEDTQKIIGLMLTMQDRNQMINTLPSWKTFALDTENKVSRGLKSTVDRFILDTMERPLESVDLVRRLYAWMGVADELYSKWLDSQR